MLNLDCMTQDELFAIGIDKELYHEDYREYARLKFNAQKFRLEGKIQRAEFYEKQCEEVYNWMPEELQW